MVEVELPYLLVSLFFTALLYLTLPLNIDY
jgi:hypothetical protein